MIRMILLSEIAENIRNEIHSWPSHQNLKVEILVDPSLGDAREGEKNIFTELLMMPVGLLPASVSRIDIRISGNNEEIRVYFNFNSASARSIPLWKNLAEKAAAWNPQVHMREHGVDITLDLPVSPAYPPVDLRAMARETGINIEDARTILEGFLINARTYISILKTEIGKPEKTPGNASYFRAAHSLKGAGKTLRAPELAAAAGALERKIKEKGDTTEEQRRLEAIWDRIEFWFEGNGYER